MIERAEQADLDCHRRLDSLEPKLGDKYQRKKRIPQNNLIGIYFIKMIIFT